MKKVEIFLILMAVIALILKLSDISISNLILTASLGSLSVFYIYLGAALYENKEFKELSIKSVFRGMTGDKMTLTTLASYAMSISLIGILFNLQHWPGGLMILNVGLLGSLIALIVIGIKYRKSPSDTYRNILVRLAIIGSAALIISFLSQSFIQ